MRPLLLALALTACHGPFVTGTDPVDPGDTTEPQDTGPFDTGSPAPVCGPEDLIYEVYAENHAGRRCTVCGTGELTIVGAARNPCDAPIEVQTSTSCLVGDILVAETNQVTFVRQGLCYQASSVHTVPALGELRESGTYRGVNEGTVTLQASFHAMEKPLVQAEVTMVAPDWN